MFRWNLDTRLQKVNPVFWSSMTKCAIERQLFKAYIRSQHFKKLGARDATYVRIQYQHGENMAGGFARTNYLAAASSTCWPT